MTAPPGGPYGQNPYGQNPSGQNPSGQNPSGQNPYGQNPYGQGPYWGGQPQGGGYPYPPPGGPYVNPQGAPNPPGAANPYAAGGYPPQQFPQPGQQAPPGWQGGPYPPGPPPGGPRSKAPWLILGGIAILGVIALAVILVIGLSSGNKSNTAKPSTATTSAPTSEPNSSMQTATDCTPNVSGGDKPSGAGPVTAGKLSFPATAAPGWAPFSDDQSPNLIGAVGLGQEVPNAKGWMMLAEVAVTNFVTSMDVTAQASKLIQCVSKGQGYASATPTLGPVKTSSIKVDGVKAARADADVTIADTSIGVKGDSLVIIAVDTKPVTIFMGATPIGDAAAAGVVNGIIAALKVGQ
jgi:hypothetical protein